MSKKIPLIVVKISSPLLNHKVPPGSAGFRKVPPGSRKYSSQRNFPPSGSLYHHESKLRQSQYFPLLQGTLDSGARSTPLGSVGIGNGRLCPRTNHASPSSWSNWISQLAAWKLYPLCPPATTPAAAAATATTSAGHFQAQSPDLRNWLGQDVS